MSSKKFRIAIFASGNGSNAEAIVRHFQDHPAISIELVLSNNPAAGVLQRAERLGVPAMVFTRDDFRTPGMVLEKLTEKQITHIVLAGFLWLVPEYLIKAFPDRIVNIHPALLPRFGGKGMYGMNVHEAVRAAGEKETGITIHLVNEHYDEGEVLFQGRCPIEETYTSKEIAACVQALEYEHYPSVIEKWIMNR